MKKALATSISAFLVIAFCVVALASRPRRCEEEATLPSTGTWRRSSSTTACSATDLERSRLCRW